VPDEKLVTIGGIVFTIGVIVLVVMAVLVSTIFPGLWLVVVFPGACIVVGVLVVLAGGFKEEVGARVVFVRRFPVPAMPVSTPPRFCAQCGADLPSAGGASACPACGAAV